jgi:hypothetical protein
MARHYPKRSYGARLEQSKGDGISRILKGKTVNKIVGFFIEKNVTNYPEISYSDYWRLARMQSESPCLENRYNKYICAWIPISWPKNNSECLLGISKFTEEVILLEKNEQEGFVEYSDEMNVSFESNGVQFSCLIDSWEETAEGNFFIAEVIVLLGAWHRFLQMPDSEESRMEIVLP